MLFSIVKDPAISANELNQDLETIRQWARQWKMEFNPDPTKQATELLFSYKKKPPVHPPLYFNGNIVTKVDEQKHLGLILDKKLTFKSHITAKITKTKKTYWNNQTPIQISSYKNSCPYVQVPCETPF